MQAYRTNLALVTSQDMQQMQAYRTNLGLVASQDVQQMQAYRTYLALVTTGKATVFRRLEKSATTYHLEVTAAFEVEQTPLGEFQVPQWEGIMRIAAENGKRLELWDEMRYVSPAKW